MNQKQLRLLAALLFVAVVGAIGQSGLPNVALHPNRTYRPLMSGLPIITSGGQADGGLCPTLATGNIAYWSFDFTDGGIPDLSGNGHDVTRSITNISWDAGLIGEAVWPLTFTGAQLVAPTLPVFVTQPGAFTVSVWVKPAATQGNPYAGLAARSTSEGLFLHNTKFSYYLAGDHETAASWVADTWQHVVITYDGANMTFWVNGVQDNTYTLAPAIANPYQLVYLTSATNPYNLSGLMDETGVWDRKLTDAEIVCLYNFGVGVYHPFAPITPTPADGTDLRRNLHRHFTFTNSLLFDGGPSSSDSYVADQVPVTSFVTYSGFAGQGGMTSPHYVSPGVGTANVNAAIATAGTWALNSFSIGLWVNPQGNWTDANGYGGAIWSRSNFNEGLYAHSNGRYVFVSGGTGYDFGTSWDFGWQYVLFTYDQYTQDANLYVNGVAGTTQHVGALTFSSFLFGALENYSNFNGLRGGIDEFSVWQHRVLTAADGLLLYNNGYGVPLSAFTSTTGAWRHSGLVSGTPGTYSSYAYRTTNDSALNLSGDFTISMWVRRQSNTLTVSEVVQKFDPGTNGGWRVYFSTDNKLHADFWNAVSLVSSYGLYDGATVPGPAQAQGDSWFHVAIRRSGNDYSLWVNGVSDITTTNAAANTSTTNPIFVGRNHPSDAANPNYTATDVSDLVIWSVDLTDTDVKALYNGARPTAYPDGLQAAWYFNNDLQDSSGSGRHLTVDGGVVVYTPR